METRRVLRGVTALVGATALAVPLSYAATASATSPSGRHVLTNTMPAWAISSHVIGDPAATRQLTVSVHLQLRDAAGAAALARAVSDPSSAEYGHYLTTSQFNARFAPSTSTVHEVESFLRSAGLVVKGVPANHRFVSATGSVADVQQAFATTLHTYSVGGRSDLGPANALSVPSDLAPAVLTVTGIGDALAAPDSQRVVPAKGQPDGQVPPPSACSHYWGEKTQTVPKAYGQTSFPTYICGYTPGQYQQAYGIADAIAKGNDGTGTKVAIVDAYASPTIESDANTLFSHVGTPAFTERQFSQKTFAPFNRQAACGTEPGWWGEETLDVEAVHATAPGANQLYVGAQNCGAGLDFALNWIVSHVDKPKSSAYGVSMISDSFGIHGEGQPAGRDQAEMAIFTQAAIEGVGVYFSSGDSGDESTLGHTATPQPDLPAAYPLVTAVGGTSLQVDSHDGYQLETGWGTDLDFVNIDGDGNEDGYTDTLPGAFYFGAGGGTSHLYQQPWYQRHQVPDALARSFDGTRRRVVPDVAMDGDPYTGMLEGQTVDGVYTEYGIGGTSLACPLFVGLQATAQGKGNAIGFANPTLYHLDASAFRDVRTHRTPIGVTNPSGSYLVTLGKDSTLSTSEGYDNVTGRGTPDGTAFLSAEWAAVNG